MRTFHYGDLKALAPAHKGFFEGTPIVNDEFLHHIRQGKVVYIRGDTQSFTPTGLQVNVRGEVWSHGYTATFTADDVGQKSEGGRWSQPGDEGDVRGIDADIVVLATGFKQPTVDFLPKDLFPERYEVRLLGRGYREAFD